VTLDNVTVEIDGDDTLNILGTVTNNSVILFQDMVPGGNPALLYAGSGAQLAGNGQTLFSTNFSQNQIGPIGGTLTIGADQTVTTTPTAIGRFIVDVINLGTIDADGGQITLDCSITNENILRARNSGKIRQGPAAELIFTGHELTIEPGSSFESNVSTVTGGSITGGGLYEIVGSTTCNNVTLENITIEIGDRETLTIMGTLTNNTVISLNDTIDNSDPAELRSSGDANLEGTGQILFVTGGFQNQIGPAGGRLTIGPNQTMTVDGGASGLAEADIINYGDFELTDGTFATNAIFTNHGLIDLGDLGFFEIEASHQLVNETGGVISGTGTVVVDPSGSFENAGLVSPGLSAGTLFVNGGYTQLLSGQLDIEIGSTGHDLLSSNGPVNLDGILNATFLAGFIPGPSDSFTVIEASGISGAFSNADPGGGSTGTLFTSEGTFLVTYGATTVSLSDFQRYADLDVTKEVDRGAVRPGSIVTYTIWVENLGPGDASGVVVVDDLPGDVSYFSDDCAATGGAMVTWNVGDLVASATSFCHVEVIVDPGATCYQTNTVDISGTEPDPVSSNNAFVGARFLASAEFLDDVSVWPEVNVLDLLAHLACP